MSRIINAINAKPKLKQWLWFAGLWCGGLGAALTLGYAIKLLMRIG